MPAVAVPIYVADQVTKAWATANLVSDQPRQLVGSLLQLNLTYNSGAAFSIGTGSTVVLTAIASSVVVFVLIMARRLGSMGWALALGLLLGGALGNLTDRMLRAPGPGRGQVVDFLQLPNFPVFNIADSAIVSAAVLIALLSFRGISVDGTRVAGDPPKHRTAEQVSGQQHAPEADSPEADSAEAESAKAESPKRVAGTGHDA